MNAMLHHIEKMHEDLEGKETGSGTGEAWRLAKSASNVPSSSGDPQLPGLRVVHDKMGGKEDGGETPHQQL